MAYQKSLFNVVSRHCRRYATAVHRKVPSKFKRIEDLPVFSSITDATEPSKDQWIDVRKELVESDLRIKSVAVDGTIMQFCIAANKLSLGRSYMKFLLETGSDVHMANMGKYLNLLYINRRELTETDKSVILEIYEKIRSRNPLLDATTAENCIMAISLTDRWEDYAELLDMIKLSCSASRGTYSAIVMAAFRNGKPEIGWKYMDEMAQLKRVPYEDAYDEFMNYCLKNYPKTKDCVGEMTKLFHYFADNDILPNEIVMGRLQVMFSKLGWTGSPTKLSPQGVCLNCGRKLLPHQQTGKEVDHLRNAVLDKVIIGKNVYYKTTPEELSKFIKYVNKTKPYDVVVDGLNVAYQTRTRHGNIAVEQLATVVRHYVNENKIMLILGRRHMLRWGKQEMDYIKKNAYFFFTDNLSADDPCLLYAALAGGSNTNFVSCDLMRGHKFFLKDVALERAFKRWQMAHQVHVTFKRERMLLTPPLPYLPIAQGSEDCWHVPYQLADAPTTESYESPKNWICLQRPTKSKKSESKLR